MRAATLLLVALLLAPMALGARPAAELVALEGALPAFFANARDLGPAGADEPLSLAVALRLVDEPALLARADDGGPWLAPSQFAAMHAPAAADVEAVRAWLAEQGLASARLSADGTLLSLDTTVARAERAFELSLHRYQTGDVVLRAPASAPLVPARLAPLVQSIVGLTDAPLRAHALAADAGAPPFSPADLRAAYDVDSALAAGHDGTGTVIGITTWGSVDPAALDAYAAEYGLPPASLAHVDADGGASCGGGDVEWDLDAQMARAMAPGAAIRVYCGSSATLPGMLGALARLVAEGTPDVVSQSWGLCERFVGASDAAAFETKFAQAAAQGIAVFTASGDAGSRECTRADPADTTIAASWPATAPHTTSVGATRLALEAGAYASESAWSTCAPCPGQAWSASGGAPSLLHAKPAWQTTVGGSKRVSADVSAVGDPATGVRVHSGGAWLSVGGTSVASPLVAGMWADAIARHGRLGHAAPRLWTLAGDASALRDITTGSNGDFAAGPGYDLPTGLGTPRVAGLLEALALPGAPEGLAAAGGPGAGEVRLSWSAPFGDVTGYRIYTGTGTGALSFLAPTLGTTFVHEGLAPGVTRRYQVAAVNEAGEGARSAVATARAYEAPQPPRALATSTPVAAPVIRVTWSAPANANLAGVFGYHLFRDDILLETLPARATSYNDDLCPIGTACLYHATALGVVGESAPSGSATQMGLSAGIATTGAPSADPGQEARLLGHERLVLQFDADDAEAPLAGMTRDASLARDHAWTGLTMQTQGRHGEARLFAGDPEGIAPIVDVTTSRLSEGTLMMWVKPDAPGVLVEKTSEVTDPTLRFALGADGRLSFAAGGTTLTAPMPQPPWGAWTHVAVTWGPSGKRLYVDGALVASDLDTSGMGALSSNTRIGPGFHGAIDEVRLYDAALPSGLVQSILALPYAGTS